VTDSTLLRGARVLRSDGVLSPADILIRNGRIEQVAEHLEHGDDTEIADLKGLVLLPGFIDIHVHGGGGYSLASSRPDEIEDYSRWVTAHGVTGFLATICADSFEHGIAAVRTAVQARCDEGASLLGVNLEGPFVSPQRLGALPPSWANEPGADSLDQLTNAARGHLRVMTIAPELPGALEVIRVASASGVLPAVGHTDATFDAARQGFLAGASHVTHAFNAMRPPHHRDPATIGAALEFPDVTVEVIADGIHLHPATVRLLVNALGPDRICIITDAVTPAGLNEGVFQIGGSEAALGEDSSIHLPDGTIAGSAMTMDVAVRNLLQWNIADLHSISRMASSVPARVLGLQGNKGVIATGYDADLVALTADYRVAKTWVGGRLVYDASAS
jgi:N-acetylglucosamine-6-phosphate deacetylase